MTHTPLDTVPPFDHHDRRPEEEHTMPAPAGIPPPRSVSGPRLVLTRGPHAGDAWPLAAVRTTIGRDRGCDIVLDDSTISRRHAELHRDEHGHYTLTDTGSLNGTYRNNAPLEHTAELADGDHLTIGKARFTFHTTSDDTAPPQEQCRPVGQHRTRHSRT